MLDIEQNRTITILKPVGLSPSDFNRKEIENHQNEELGNGGAFEVSTGLEYPEIMNKIIDTTNNLILEIAEELDLQPNLYEYNLPEERNVPSRKATRAIMQSNVLGLFDPDDDQIAYAIACLHLNPSMSVIFAATDAEYLESRMTIIQTRMAHLFNSSQKFCPRIYPTHIRWKHEEDIVPTLKKALLYPYEAN